MVEIEEGGAGALTAARRLTAEQQALAAANVRLAYFAAKRYLRHHACAADRDDLTATALIGLLNAAATYDAALGFAFSTYAYTCIRNAIRTHFALLRRSGRMRSIPIYEDGRPLDFAARMETEEQAEARDLIATALPHLRPRHRQIVELHLAGHNLSEMAATLGVCKERARQIDEVARERLREVITERLR